MLAKRSWAIVVIQAWLVVCALTVAWLLRFDFTLPKWRVLVAAAPLLVILRLAAFYRFHLMHGYWRYAGMSDVAAILKAVAVGSLAFLVAERLVVGATALPLTIYCLEALLTTGLLAGVRLLSRVMLTSIELQQRRNSAKRAIVVGAGDAAELLLRELPRSGYQAVACLDDDSAKHGAHIHGVRVLGDISLLPEAAAREVVDEILIAIPSATGVQMRRIIQLCEKTHIRFRSIPALRDLVSGGVRVDQLRDVNLEDLLGREPVELDLETVRRSIEGRSVMVTGAAGSIGSELCRQIAAYRPARLVCVDQAETPLFYLQLEAKDSAAHCIYRIADITDSQRMRELITEHEVQAIFHAAAYKHVPLVEDNLKAALHNNVFGLEALVKVADQCGCEDFLLISSDKAVNPTSFMGATKRIGELIMAARPAGRMRSLSVRFGNVLGSQGSVVPVFQEQIRTKRQITVTHPGITRYFMTIPEAVSLVLQAFSIGKHGDVLVLDMGEPVRILDMARTLIRLSGVEGDDVQIVFTGLRPGEKLFEELFYSAEEELATSVQKVRRTRSQLVGWPKLLQQLDALRETCASRADDDIRKNVKELVPQYSWNIHPIPPETAKVFPIPAVFDPSPIAIPVRALDGVLRGAALEP